jgi:hypothetical protein
MSHYYPQMRHICCSHDELLTNLRQFDDKTAMLIKIERHAFLRIVIR